MNSNRILRVKYEDLVSNPEMELKRICDYLGLGFYMQMLDVVWVNTTTQSNRDVGRGIGRTSVGKWQRELDLDAIALCQFLAKEELDRLGYERTPITFITYIKTPVWIIRSGFEILMRIYRRWRKGGAHYSWNMMKNYMYRFVNITK